MEKTLRIVSNLPGCEELTPVAGKSGLDAEVKWTSVIDSIDLIQFSNEGELNFVTGLGLHSDEDVLALTEEAYKYKMAGIVFAPGGPYIKKLPESVIAFANENGFPVFTIPWESKISNYARVIGKFIIDETYPERSITDILKSILTGKEIIPFDPEVSGQLSRQGINKYDNYRVALIHIVEKNKSAEHPFKEIYGQVIKQVNDQYSVSSFIIPLKFGVALIFTGNNADDATVQQQLPVFAEKVRNLQELHEGHEIRIGFGRACNKIEKLSISYNEAALVVNLLSAKTQSKEEIYEYDKLGIYKVLWESKNQKAAMEFSKQVLEALEVYDKVNETDLMNCLKTYLECDCSVKEVSQKLYLHKNTVLYKLKKIESILNCTFSKQEDLFNLQFALKVKDVYERKI